MSGTTIRRASPGNYQPFQPISVRTPIMTWGYAAKLPKKCCVAIGIDVHNAVYYGPVVPIETDDYDFSVIVEKNLYRQRLSVLLEDAKDDDIVIHDDCVSDFWKFVEHIPFARKGNLTATLMGGLNLFWRADGVRVSIHFLGDGYVRLVVLSPACKPTVKERISVQELASEITEYSKWIS